MYWIEILFSNKMRYEIIFLQYEKETIRVKISDIFDNDKKMFLKSIYRLLLINGLQIFVTTLKVLEGD